MNTIDRDVSTPRRTTGTSRISSVLRTGGAVALAVLAAAACNRDSDTYSAADCDIAEKGCHSCFVDIQARCTEICEDCRDSIFYACKEFDVDCEDEVAADDTACQSCDSCTNEGESQCYETKQAQEDAASTSAVCE